MAIALYSGMFFNGNEFSKTEDFISIETALRISVNLKPFTVTMQTPGNEIDLARGLLFTEQIFSDIHYQAAINILERDDNGYITSLDVQLPAEYISKDFEGKRNVISGSSCGVCGKTELDENNIQALNNIEPLEASLVQKMFHQIHEEQKDFQKSGGTHAAGAFDQQGNSLTIQEDIGRHNAVDKVIGHLIRNGLLQKAKCITVSGRISYEIVNKIKLAGIPFLAAVSAPSSLAINNAQEAGICLMAFCRNQKLTIYSNAQNIVNANLQQAVAKIKTP